MNYKSDYLGTTNCFFTFDLILSSYKKLLSYFLAKTHQTLRSSYLHYLLLFTGLAAGKDMCPAVSLESSGQKVSITSGNMPPASAMEKSTAVKPGVEGQWTGRFSFSIKKVRNV